MNKNYTYNTLDEIFENYQLTYNLNKENYKYIGNEILNIFNEYREIDFENPDIIFWYGMYHYLVTNNHELIKKHFLNAINLNHVDSMYMLGVYYDWSEQTNEEIIDVELMEKYYLMAAENNHTQSMICLGFYYQEITKNFELCEKYYKMAEKNEPSSAIYSLCSFYKENKNLEMTVKYCLIGIENEGYGIFLNWLKITLKENPTRLYYELNKLPKDEYINEEINKLRNIKKVNDYINKLNHSKKYNIYDNCCVCYENELGIIIDNCCHTVCQECYHKIEKCPFCK